MSSAREIAIRMEKVSKAFGPKVVLKDVDLTLHTGENLVILGRSGIGKSVLIKCISGLLQPDSGNIEVLGRSLNDLDEKEMTELKKKVGFCFQGNALYDYMTIRENLEFPLKRALRIRDPSVLREWVSKALADVELPDVGDKVPAELSGGMKKRVGIARTLIMRPEIMLYDEPTSGLDPYTATGINRLIVSVQKKLNVSSIIITHDLACAKITADRILFLNNGKFEKEGTFDELNDQKEDQILKSFFDYYEIMNHD